MLRRIRQRIRPGWRVLELGAGDGEFAMELAASGLCGAERICALDLAPPPPSWPKNARWIQGNVFDERNWPPADIVVANLIMHHFNEDQLRWVGAQIRRTAFLFLACEPSRKRLPMLYGASVALACDFNCLTWHDMMISIRAGFRGDELPLAMGFSLEQAPPGCLSAIDTQAAVEPLWEKHSWQVSETLLGLYRLELLIGHPNG